MMKKFSEIDLPFVKKYLGVEPSFTLDDDVIETFMEAARDFVVNTNNLTPEELDASNVPVLKYLRLVKQEYLGYGVANDGKIDPTFVMYRNSMWSGDL